MPISAPESMLPESDADLAAAADFAPQHLTPLLIVVLSLVVVGGTTDVVLDRPTSWWTPHVLVEVAIILTCLVFALVLWRGWWSAVRELRRTRAMLNATARSLSERQAERDRWQREAEAERAEFAKAIAAKFAQWGLTRAEREVAFLLLQGLGHKQIAARTGRSERTVRQHAVTVYQKSGIGGRAELAAFFLQDLLPNDVAGGAESD